MAIARFKDLCLDAGGPARLVTDRAPGRDQAAGEMLALIAPFLDAC
jgi:hypothetical protein